MFNHFLDYRMWNYMKPRPLGIIMEIVITEDV